MINKNVMLTTLPVLLLLGFLGKISSIVGMQGAFFSYSNILFPALSFFNSSVLVAAFVMMRTLLLIAKAGFFPFHFLSYILPGWSATLALQTRSKFLHIALPLVCMVIFISNYSNSAAAFYAAFWLIPILIYSVGLQHIWWRSLAATFVAHAAGSVIWLYTVPMNAQDWVNLMPIVLQERLLFATGIALTYCALGFTQQMIKNISRRQKCATTVSIVTVE